MKSEGRISALGVMPAQQRLEAGHLPALNVDHGLVEQRELVALERLVEIKREQPARLQFRIHLRHEQAESAPSVRLGAVHGDVRLAQERIGVAPVGGRDCHPDAGADGRAVAIAIVGPAELAHDAGREACRLLGAVQRDLHHGELVAAEAGDEVRILHAAADAARHLLEQGIAHGMAEHVVDALELVEIDAVQRQHLALHHAGERAFHGLAEQHPVGEPGERVVSREIGDALLRAPPIGDVLVRRHPAAVRHRAVPDNDETIIAQPQHAVARLPARHHGEPALHEVLSLADVRAAGEPMLQDLLERGAGPGKLGRQAIERDETLVADHQPPLAVEHCKPVRHVLERGDKAHVLHVELVLAPLELGDVLVGTHPAAAGKRLVDERDHAPVGELHGLAGGLAGGDVGEDLRTILHGIAVEVSEPRAVFKQGAKRRARTRILLG